MNGEVYTSCSIRPQGEAHYNCSLIPDSLEFIAKGDIENKNHDKCTLEIAHGGNDVWLKGFTSASLHTLAQKIFALAVKRKQFEDDRAKLIAESNKDCSQPVDHTFHAPASEDADQDKCRVCGRDIHSHPTVAEEEEARRSEFVERGTIPRNHRRTSFRGLNG
jgi:hypothetical protein